MDNRSKNCGGEGGGCLGPDMTVQPAAFPPPHLRNTPHLEAQEFDLKSDICDDQDLQDDADFCSLLTGWTTEAKTAGGKEVAAWGPI
mmetsp:Transcript_33157/g.68443  ORF Transcript_33157/g.68443 Transcript_33157/m.68443 type:complete len:87 (+) Transcript_33157:148-408(+)